jgi:hypothetical protein
MAKYKKITDDHCETQKKDWEAIKKYIPCDKVLWDPFYCKGLSGKLFQEMGFNIIHKNEDFFKVNYGEFIITNPPFSIKKQVLQRLIELNKPFICIIPLEVIQCKYYLNLFANSNDKPQLIIPKDRLNFIRNGVLQKGNINVCIYLCWKINLENDITYLATKKKVIIKKKLIACF